MLFIDHTFHIVRGIFDKLGEVLKVRQSLKDPMAADLPAKLSYVHPAHGEDTIAVDAGLDLNLLKAFDVSDEIRQRNEADAFAEYHKNSGSTPQVDTLLAGAQAEHNLGRFYLGDGLDEWGNWLAEGASYKRDNVVSGEGFLGEIFYKPYNKALGINSNQSFTFVEYQIIPSLGFQYETGNGASSKFSSGYRVSFRAGLGLIIDPFPDQLHRRLEWSNTVTYWGQISTSGGYDQYDRNEYFFQSSLNLYLDQAKQLALGVDYTYGDNLTTNQFDRDMWTFSFKAKFGK